MSGLGFSLKWLLAVVMFAAIALAAFFNPSQVWESVIGLATAVFLLTTIVAALCSQGGRRAFWIGCLVFAWGYLFIADNPLRDNVRHPTLLTHVALKSFHEFAHSEISAVVSRERAKAFPYQLSASKIQQIQSDYMRTRSYARRTGHYFFAWIFAAVGGFAGSYFYAAREQNS